MPDYEPHKTDLNATKEQLTEKLSFFRAMYVYAQSQSFVAHAAEWLPYGQKRITELEGLLASKA